MAHRRSYVERVQSGDLSWIYGAALSAASNEETAAEAVKAALAAPAEEPTRRTLMARAVVRALERSPKQPLDALPQDEREAIALARIVGMDVEEIAAFTGAEAGDVKSQMRSGLARLSGRLSALG